MKCLDILIIYWDEMWQGMQLSFIDNKYYSIPHGNSSYYMILGRNGGVGFNEWQSDENVEMTE